MSETNGRLPSPPRMTRHGLWSERASPLRMLPLVLPLRVRLLSLLTLLALVLLLAGCATPSGTPTGPARNPQPPQLSEPLPSESYLQQAQKLIESWRNAVTGM
jgi:hypothetical protein